MEKDEAILLVQRLVKNYTGEEITPVQAEILVNAGIEVLARRYAPLRMAAEIIAVGDSLDPEVTAEAGLKQSGIWKED